MPALTRLRPPILRPVGIAAATAAVLLVILLWQIPQTTPGGAEPAALRVQWDPESGTFVPATGADKAGPDGALARSLDRSAVGLTARTHSDGGVSVDLQGRFRSLSVATTGADGIARTGCVTNPQELEAFLAGDGAHNHGQER